VSGGCVEGEVIRAAKEVMRSGRQQMLEFGVTDDEAWDVGLACGGQIQILVEPVE
jgi:xanthine/CO dehydrogenase XdhC/CoxF family maturation factor